MFRLAVLCLAVAVSVASAWDWHGKNRDTECGGKFKPLGGGWFRKSYTDVDTRQLLADIDTLDADKDGYLAFAEVISETTLLSIDPRLSINSGIPRCDNVNFDMKRYGMSLGVTNVHFSLIDGNNDGVYSPLDMTPELLNMNDKDGDGRVSRCEMYKGFIYGIQMAEYAIYERELKYQNLVWESREPKWWHWFQW